MDEGFHVPAGGDRFQEHRVVFGTRRIDYKVSTKDINGGHFVSEIVDHSKGGPARYLHQEHQTLFRAYVMEMAGPPPAVDKRLPVLAQGYNPSHTPRMKTAISIPDKLFESGEQFTRGRGMSRSELYATALRRYLEEHRAGMITERLDEIYGVEPGALDPDIARLQTRSLPEDDW